MRRNLAEAATTCMHQPLQTRLTWCGWRHPTSPYVTLRHPTSPYVTLRHPTSPYVTLRHTTSPLFILRHPTSSYVTLLHPTSPYLILRHPHSPYVTLRHLICLWKLAEEANSCVLETQLISNNASKHPQKHCELN